jgi:hypothetical protein
MKRKPKKRSNPTVKITFEGDEEAIQRIINYALVAWQAAVLHRDKRMWNEARDAMAPLLASLRPSDGLRSKKRPAPDLSVLRGGQHDDEAEENGAKAAAAEPESPPVDPAS